MVTTERKGPFLEITADSLADDTDGDGVVTDRGSGTYAARLFIRAWSGPSESPLSSLAFAVVDILVKVGANNPPQFAGDATGFAITLFEGNDESDPMPAWSAGDLDAGGDTNDSLVYGLNGTTSKNASVAGGIVTLREIRGDNPATPTVESDFVVSLALVGKNLNFESGQSPFEVGLYVTDRWSDPVRIPIEITLIDVNELTLKREIPDQRLSNGLSTTFDLTQHFEDPEGDAVTYDAYTNLYDDVVEVNNDLDTFTIHGKHAKEGDGGESTVTVTVIAQDSKGKIADPLEFELVTRYTNQTPSFTVLEGATVAIGRNVFEADSAGKVLLPLIEYKDDDPAPTPVLSHEPIFEAIVDPYLNEGTLCSAGSADCFQHMGEVAIVVGDEDLNFEVTKLHKISLALRDAWQSELVSEPLEIHVAVNDSNDAPSVVSGTSIETQRIVVQGSDSYRTGRHFMDEDGDRLRVDAVSSDRSVVEVEVVGLDEVFFNGLKEGDATITLTAVDPHRATVDLTFRVEVGPNNAPLVDEDAVNAQLPANNVLAVGSFAEIDLMTLFIEGDSGDRVVSVAADTSDEEVLLAIPIDDGNTTTLVGRASGTATLTIAATDLAGNTTTVEREIIVNVPPAAILALDPVTIDRTTPHVIELAGIFSDSDHSFEELVITAEAIGEEERVSLNVVDMQLTIVGVMGASPGDVEIQLTATDPHGATANSTFIATVVNIGPTVASTIGAQELDRINPLTLDISDVFDDSDGEIQTVTVTVSDERIVGSSELNESNMITLTGIALGSTNISLTATDDNGAYTTATFDVTVVNVEPIVVSAIADQRTTRTRDLVIRLGSTFNDPDADNELLTITALVEQSNSVRATVDGRRLTLVGLAVGTSKVTLKASDADGGTVETSFITTIENLNPVATGSLMPIHLEVGGDAATRSMASLFLDDDPLSYTISVTDASIAHATTVGSTAMISPLSRGATVLEVTATDPHGAQAVVTGSVLVSDSQLKAVAAESLGSFGRAMIASVSSSIGQRVLFDTRASDSTLDSWAPMNNVDSIAPVFTKQHNLNWDIVHRSSRDRDIDTVPIAAVEALQSMVGQDFALNLGSSDNPSNWAIWGSGDFQSYEGDGYDGTTSSVYLGTDATLSDSWVVGVAVAKNLGESDYTWGSATQSMDMRLSSVLPYLSFRPTERTLIWGVAGFGSGELETTVVGEDDHMSSLSSRLALIGTNQSLMGIGRFNLALRGDAAFASLQTDEGQGAADSISTDVSRIRLGLESSVGSQTDRGRLIEPFGQVHLRSDAGDGENGTGVEIVGGARLLGDRFHLEVQGRALAMHGVDDYSESGFSVLAKLNPSADGTGFSAAVTPRWGSDAAGTDILWQNTVDLNSILTYGAIPGLGYSPSRTRVDAQLTYGLLVVNESYLLTPFIDVGVSDLVRRDILFGVDLHRSTQRSRSFDVNLAVGRIQDRAGSRNGTFRLNMTMTL